MDFSLSSSLVGSAVSNPDKLALDLQFAADKTLTARKGPTPAFTRGSSGTFVGSDGLIQSAGTNVARFDHDPVTLACKGLLIEEPRTNLVFPSDTLTTQTRTVTAVAYTLSFYGTGTVVLSGVAIATVVGSGVYPARTTLTFTPTAGSLILTVTGTVQFAQLEVGSFPTSYIPTTTASVIRSADVCSISGSAFSGFYNTPEGTLFAIASTLSTNLSIRRIFSMTDGTSANRAGLLFNSIGQPTTFVVSSGGSLSALIASSVASITSPVKIAGAYKLNDFAISANGSVVTTDTLGLVGTGINRLGIGNQNDTEFVNGHIASMRYFKKRLANAKLQTITV